jgi:phage gpG-like protein
MSEFIRRIAGKIGNDTMRVFKTEHLEDWVCRLAGEHEGAALMQKSRLIFKIGRLQILFGVCFLQAQQENAQYG